MLFFFVRSISLSDGPVLSVLGVPMSGRVKCRVGHLKQDKFLLQECFIILVHGPVLSDLVSSVLNV